MGQHQCAVHRRQCPLLPPSDVFDDATHSITVLEETLHLLKVDYAEGVVTFFGDNYKLYIPSSGSQHQIELESDNLILTLYDGEPDV